MVVLQDAFATIAEGHEGAYEADLYRLKGELMLQRPKASLGQVQGKSQQVDGLLHSPSHSRFSSLDTQDVTLNTEAEAEQCLLQAIGIAQKQQAKSLELRAAISLVRLRQQQVFQDASQRARAETWEKLDEAHHTLSHVYNWFTEGFDTRDLRMAKALLEKLNEADTLPVTEVRSSSA